MRQRLSRPGSGYYQYLSLLAVTFVVLTPMTAAVLGGFKTLGELRVDPFGLPDQWRLEYYGRILADPWLWRLLFVMTFNSLADSRTRCLGARVCFSQR